MRDLLVACGFVAPTPNYYRESTLIVTTQGSKVHVFSTEYQLSYIIFGISTQNENRRLYSYIARLRLLLYSNVQKNWAKVLEACLVAAASALVLTALIYGAPDCQPIEGYHPPNDTSHVTSHQAEAHASLM